MDETVLQVRLSEDLLDEARASLEPGETLDSLVKQALQQYLTVRENRISQGNSIYFEQTGLLRASLMLRTRHLKATILFYQQLGFSVVYRHPHLDLAVLGSRGLRIALFERTDLDAVGQLTGELTFSTDLNLEYLAQRLTEMGLPVDEEALYESYSSGEITVTDPDGRTLSISAEKPDLIHAVNEGFAT